MATLREQANNLPEGNAFGEQPNNLGLLATLREQPNNLGLLATLREQPDNLQQTPKADRSFYGSEGSLVLA